MADKNFGEYVKPTIKKYSKNELERFIISRANSACGNLGCETVYAGNKPDCDDVYHNACLDENNWTSGECITGGSWKDRWGAVMRYNSNYIKEIIDDDNIALLEPDKEKLIILNSSGHTILLTAINNDRKNAMNLYFEQTGFPCSEETKKDYLDILDSLIKEGILLEV